MPFGSSLATKSPQSLSASVGRMGVNQRDDVLVVQRLLNAAGASIREDGRCGRATISAVEEYQRNWTRNPDGRVDIGGATWRNLRGGRLRIRHGAYVILPQVCGHGYYSYASAERQFGTDTTVNTLVRVCQAFTKKFPHLQVGIGDLSLANGAHMAPHKTHRSGRNADIRPLRTDSKMSPVSISAVEYSREYTKGLVELLRSESNVKSILFNDSGIAGVTYWEGHDNHLHVSMNE